MRRLLYISTLLVLTSIYSCDKITNPIINKGSSVGIPVVASTYVDGTAICQLMSGKVLVEDYSTHHCTNCHENKQCETNNRFGGK